jgi:hypothetical protein
MRKNRVVKFERRPRSFHEQREKKTDDLKGLASKTFKSVNVCKLTGRGHVCFQSQSGDVSNRSTIHGIKTLPA